jgi:ATP-dependent DNA helicase RecG
MENINTEYKENWSTELLITICAFANTKGGTLFIGKNDNDDVVGVKDAKRLIKNISNMIKNDLSLPVAITLLNENDNDIIQIDVPEYKDAINYHGRYYKRIGSINQEITNKKLYEFLLKKAGIQWVEITEPDANMDDLDLNALKIFRKRLIRSGRLNEKEINPSVSDSELLSTLGLIKNNELTKAAMLLFGEEPERFAFGCYAKIGLFRPNAEIVYHDEIP